MFAVLVWHALAALRVQAARSIAATDRAISAVVLDPNRARVHELAAVPGLGPSRARAIVLDRVRIGPFDELSDLDRVDGIGPTTIERLAPYLRIDRARIGRRSAGR